MPAAFIQFYFVGSFCEIRLFEREAYLLLRIVEIDILLGGERSFNPLVGKGAAAFFRLYHAAIGSYYFHIDSLRPFIRHIVLSQFKGYPQHFRLACTVSFLFLTVAAEF